MTPRTLRIPSELQTKLETWAKADGRTCSNYVVQVLTSHAKSRDYDEAKAKAKK